MATGEHPAGGRPEAAGQGRKPQSVTRELDLKRLQQAAGDFRYLLDRSYPRQPSLTLVGNRYNLDHLERHLLHRSVFARREAESRRRKQQRLADLRGGPIALDGHNVLITLECSLQGLPLVAADDGFIRDVGEVSRSYRPSWRTDTALHLLARYLQSHQIGPVSIWYDAPLSRSGELAARTRQILLHYGLAVTAQAVAVPENHLIGFVGPVGTSDTALIDQVAVVVDVAGEIIRQQPDTFIVSLAASPA